MPDQIPHNESMAQAIVTKQEKLVGETYEKVTPEAIDTYTEQLGEAKIKEVARYAFINMREANKGQKIVQKSIQEARFEAQMLKDKIAAETDKEKTVTAETLKGIEDVFGFNMGLEASLAGRGEEDKETLDIKDPTLKEFISKIENKAAINEWLKNEQNRDYIRDFIFRTMSEEEKMKTKVKFSNLHEELGLKEGDPLIYAISMNLSMGNLMTDKEIKTVTNVKTGHGQTFSTDKIKHFLKNNKSANGESYKRGLYAAMGGDKVKYIPIYENAEITFGEDINSNIQDVTNEDEFIKKIDRESLKKLAPAEAAKKAKEASKGAPAESAETTNESTYPIEEVDELNTEGLSKVEVTIDEADYELWLPEGFTLRNGQKKDKGGIIASFFRGQGTAEWQPDIVMDKGRLHITTRRGDQGDLKLQKQKGTRKLALITPESLAVQAEAQEEAQQGADEKMADQEAGQGASVPPPKDKDHGIEML